MSEEQDFWPWFVGVCNKANLWDSNIEEHNRYRHPPPNTSLHRWARGLFINKYGDYSSIPNIIKGKKNDQ